MVFKLNRRECAYEHKGGVCCGRKIEFYDKCGHTLTHTDHHGSCPENQESWPTFPTTAPKTSLEWAQPKNRLPPAYELQCEKLHCFVQIFHDKCTCHYGWDHKKLGYPVRSDPGEPIIPADVILERRLYWLREQERARLVEHGFAMREFETLMVCAELGDKHLNDPLQQTFSYDFQGQTGTFLTTVMEGNLGPDPNPACKICDQTFVEKADLRRLPCGCLLDMSCIRRWFRSRKCCPVCDRKFRLIKVPGDWENHWPVWNDDYGMIPLIGAQGEATHASSQSSGQAAPATREGFRIAEIGADGIRRESNWFFAEDGLVRQKTRGSTETIRQAAKEGSSQEPLYTNGRIGASKKVPKQGGSSQEPLYENGKIPASIKASGSSEGSSRTIRPAPAPAPARQNPKDPFAGMELKPRPSQDDTVIWRDGRGVPYYTGQEEHIPSYVLARIQKETKGLTAPQSSLPRPLEPSLQRPATARAAATRFPAKTDLRRSATTRAALKYSRDQEPLYTNGRKPVANQTAKPVEQQPLYTNARKPAADQTSTPVGKEQERTATAPVSTTPPFPRAPSPKPSVASSYKPVRAKWNPALHPARNNPFVTRPSAAARDRSLTLPSSAPTLGRSLTASGAPPPPSGRRGAIGDVSHVSDPEKPSIWTDDQSLRTLSFAVEDEDEENEWA